MVKDGPFYCWKKSLSPAENSDAEGLRTRNTICKGNCSRSRTDVSKESIMDFPETQIEERMMAQTTFSIREMVATTPRKRRAMYPCLGLCQRVKQRTCVVEEVLSYKRGSWIGGGGGSSDSEEEEGESSDKGNETESGSWGSRRMSEMSHFRAEVLLGSEEV